MLFDALDDEGLGNRFNGVELVKESDVFVSLYFEEKAEVDVSNLEFKLVSLIDDGRLVDGTYTGNGGSLKLFVTVVEAPLLFTLTVTVLGAIVVLLVLADNE